MTVVITGASSGIGRATALAFARRGDQVVLAGRSRTSLDHVARECRDLGAPATVAPTDVSDPRQVDSLLDFATTGSGKVDLVVHCAAVVAYGRFDEVPADVYERVLRVDVDGTVQVARAALRRFEDQGSGQLVLFGSVLGKIAPPFMSAYVTSKWAVHGLARALQTEYRDRPAIHVSLVVPGAVDTPVYEHAGNYAGRAAQPPPPVASADKVAAAVVRLADRPRREVNIGLANTVMELGFRFLPAVYDALVTPMMKRLGLTRTPVGPTPGNVFEPRR
ncbi:short-subunit dehydrogenase [Kribbella amoyensis]|uniref:Short-subunit dehydrogenase n=1 Tax=Kribbella amoyensis TaxID=996641 RepID=A0A561BU78_9ACTN|nr:SDR family NAD(P)-dependent oxidoreductase [Kribbella amoyensis]TWD82465.1 short-subunit dehydrogenase [Kribbella amoyensis]